MFNYRIAASAEDYRSAALLFKEYAGMLGIDLGFQHFEEELEQLTKMYVAPGGGIILCSNEHLEDVACAALRRINSNTAELKRMYVKAESQGMGIGKILLDRAVKLAKAEQYSFIRLDTLDHMTAAINLYKQYGFYEIPAYYHNPNAGAVYFEIKC